MAPSRRQFLASALGVLGAYGCRRESAPVPAPVPATATPKRPRYLVILQMSGGPDAVLTLDPKGRAEVESWVDNPLPDKSVSAGEIRLGAHFAPLLAWAPKMAIVQGVRVDTVNHIAGSWQLNRMRRRVTHTTPTLLDIVAKHRDSQPLGALTVGDLIERAFSPAWSYDGFPYYPGQPPIHQGFGPLEKLEPDDAAMLARAMRQHARDTSLRPADRRHYEQVAALLERLPHTTKFQPEQDWAPKTGRARMFASIGDGLQRVLWALENDLIACAFVIVTRNEWDTHTRNRQRQTAATEAFLPVLERFLQQLERRSNAHGTLAANTTLVISGELGRYPRINSDDGKDHYPEMPMLFMGAGIRGGTVFGRTGKDMLGLPVDNATGKLGGSRHVVLDDVGATLLRLFGIEPTRYGYTGRPIEPIVRS